MSLPYRPEIDGLRALAVGLVILFHADIPGFSGGYLGVDVFFVISGFLITSILAHEIRAGGFSYWGFVERRARRILPPLILVMLACIPFAWWLMLPDALQNFGQSLVATTLSTNNILLWLTTGYWDLSSEFKPLLHTWSLGVEEQFYILYPAVLLLALKRPRRQVIAIFTALAFLSIVLMVRALGSDPAGAFYLLHFRAWQLLVGGLGALLMMDGGYRGHGGLALTGLVLIFSAVLIHATGQVSIAVPMLIATAGSILFLTAAQGGGAAHWLLSRPTLVWLGLLSYSLYLWHQPVFAFLRISRFDETGPFHFVATIPLVVILSWASWKLVETPFRDTLRISRQSLFACVAGGMIATSSSGLALHIADGVPARMAGIDTNRVEGATIAYNERIRRLPGNLPDDVGARPVILVVGNSFARDFANVLIEAGLGSTTILLYRTRLPLCPDKWSPEEVALVRELDALIFASGHYDIDCALALQTHLRENSTRLWFVGTKHFGYNLNPLVNLDPKERASVRLEIPLSTLLANDRQVQALGNYYINLIAGLSIDNANVRVADTDGFLLSTDRIHLSQAGARYLAQNLPLVSAAFAALTAMRAK